MRRGFGFHDRHSPFRFDPATLFIGGAIKGAFYDPSNITTLFQDDAGTTPVTAVEQTVGRILDLSGNGSHATQSVLASRPTYRARYNLLTFTEQLANATAWPDLTGSSGGNAPIRTANAGTAPNGTMTATRLQLDAAGATSGFRSGVRQTITIINGQSYTRLIYLKAYDSGSVGKSVRVIVDGAGSASIVTLTDSWQAVSASVTSASTSGIFIVECRGGSTTQTADVLAWGAQILTAADVAATGGIYQRVNAATDYDTGSPVWRPYIAFDGSNDSMLTSAINFTGTNKMTVIAGVSKLSDAAFGVISELSPDVDSNNGGFLLGADTAARYGLQIGLVGNRVYGSIASYASPITNVTTLQLDSSQSGTAQLVTRANGATPGTVSLTVSGAGMVGNFGNYPLYIGRRNNASLPFNGRLYGLIVLGAAASDWQIQVTEQWMAGKTGLQF